MITGAKKILKEDGQAIMEFVLFLPFMMMMYFSILSVGNAINGSINQQKAARGYFYYRMGNSSVMPKPRRDGFEPSDGWGTFGMQIMGWAERFQGDSPVAPCFKFQMPLGEIPDGDACENAYSGNKTQFIRVQTVYGICGATYKKAGNNQKVRLPGGSGFSPAAVTDADACSLTN